VSTLRGCTDGRLSSLSEELDRGFSSIYSKHNIAEKTGSAKKLGERGSLKEARNRHYSGVVSLITVRELIFFTVGQEVLVREGKGGN